MKFFSVRTSVRPKCAEKTFIDLWGQSKVFMGNDQRSDGSRCYSNSFNKPSEQILDSTISYTSIQAFPHSTSIENNKVLIPIERKGSLTLKRWEKVVKWWSKIESTHTSKKIKVLNEQSNAPYYIEQKVAKEISQ